MVTLGGPASWAYNFFLFLTLLFLVSSTVNIIDSPNYLVAKNNKIFALKLTN
jgi:hypothetical protein